MKSIAIVTILLLAGVFLFNLKGTQAIASYLSEEGDDDEMIGQEALKHI